MTNSRGPISHLKRHNKNKLPIAKDKKEKKQYPSAGKAVAKGTTKLLSEEQIEKSAHNVKGIESLKV